MHYCKVIGMAAVISGALGVSTAANAASIDFSNIASGGLALGPFAFGDASFTVDADTFDVVQPASFPTFDITLNNDPDAAVTVTAEGLGVDNGGAANPGSDDVDGNNNNDILLFTFDRAIELLRIDFDNVGGGDSFVFFATNDPNDLLGQISVTDFLIVDEASDEGGFDFAPPVASLIFGIGAVRDGDDFRVEGLTGTVAPIPLPAAGWMLLAGIGGLAAMRRRKKAA